MPEEIKAETTIEIPSSKDLPKEPPNPQADQVIAAAIQTGAAAERTEAAATEATQAAAKSEATLQEIRNLLKPELEAISERLRALEEMEAEEIEEPSITSGDEEDTPTVASAEIVTLDEPHKQKEEIPTKQDEPPQKNQERGGFIKRLLLNS